MRCGHRQPRRPDGREQPADQPQHEGEDDPCTISAGVTSNAKVTWLNVSQFSVEVR
jgi:hypothetical protein